MLSWEEESRGCHCPMVALTFLWIFYAMGMMISALWMNSFCIFFFLNHITSKYRSHFNTRRKWGHRTPLGPIRVLSVSVRWTPPLAYICARQESSSPFIWNLTEALPIAYPQPPCHKSYGGWYQLRGPLLHCGRITSYWVCSRLINIWCCLFTRSDFKNRRVIVFSYLSQAEGKER